MQVDILNLDGKSVGKVELSDSIFGIDPRADILHRVVTWQRANARAGTHAVKTVSDVAGSGKKAFKQKKAFLKTHLTNWVHSFSGDILRYAGLDFYKGVAKITGGFLKKETEFLKEGVSAWDIA